MAAPRRYTVPMNKPRKGLKKKKPRRDFLPAALAAAVAVVALASGFAYFSAGRGEHGGAGISTVVLPPPSERLPGDVAGYMRDCVTGVLRGTAPPESCRSLESAHQAYGVDVWLLLRAEHARASDTARRIVQGQILNDADYRACIGRGECAALPVPRDVKDPARQEQALKVLRYLAAGGAMNRNICAFVDMCRALVKTGLYDPGADAGGG